MHPVTRVDDPQFFLSHPFDLSSPLQVLRTVENLFQHTGGPAVPNFVFLPYLNFLGALIGLALGLGDAGWLYGPIGGIIGAGLGYGLARGGGFLLVRFFLARLSCTHALARAIKADQYQVALDRAERFWTLKVESDPARAARSRLWPPLIRLRDLLLAQAYSLPASMLAANLQGLMGLLHEALGQPQAAIVRYQRALACFPDHAFVVYLTLGLLERHPGLEFERPALLQSLRCIQRQRDNYARFIFILYHDLLDRLFPEVSGHYPASSAENFSPSGSAAEPLTRPVPPPASASGGCFLRLIENPGEPVASGLLIVEGERVCVVRLAPLLFQLVRYLALTMRQESHLPHASEQQGWVSAQELAKSLPGLEAREDPDTILRLAAKLQEQFQEAGISQPLLEQNPSGCLRLAAAPSQIVLEPNPSARI